VTNLPVPNPRTFVSGEFETAAYFNALRDAINFLANPPLAVLHQQTTQAIGSGNFASLALDATDQDFYGMHSNSTNNSRATAIVAGTYEVTGTVSWPSNATGARGCRIAKNGTAVLGSASFTGTTNGDVYAITTPAFQVQLNVGDYVEVQGFQSSGGSLSTLVVAGDVRSSMNIRWVHA
jgi:hypothetical protein